MDHGGRRSSRKGNRRIQVLQRNKWGKWGGRVILIRDRKGGQYRKEREDRKITVRMSEIAIMNIYTDTYNI